jgi:hypothetical protein
MKQIDTTQVVDPSTLQPFTARSLKFLQDAKAEDDAGIIQALITNNTGSYSLTTPYVISGCVVSDSGKDVTDGKIFYGGKFYEVTGVNGTTNVARFILTKTQDATADPLQFTDGTNKNVHDIYKYVATDVASGGDFTSAALVSAYGSVVSQNIDLATQSTSSTSYADMTGLTYTTPNDGKSRTLLFLFKGFANATASGNEGIGYELYDSTNATSLDTNEAYLDVSVQTDDFRIPVSLQHVGVIAPNTTIKVRFKLLAGAGCASKLNRLTIVEL